MGELQWFPAGALADYITWEPLQNDSARGDDELRRGHCVDDAVR
jgi:hypothetical protein